MLHSCGVRIPAEFIPTTIPRSLIRSLIAARKDKKGLLYNLAGSTLNGLVSATGSFLQTVLYSFGYFHHIHIHIHLNINRHRPSESIGYFKCLCAIRRSEFRCRDEDSDRELSPRGAAARRYPLPHKVPLRFNRSDGRRPRLCLRRCRCSRGEGDERFVVYGCNLTCSVVT